MKLILFLTAILSASGMAADPFADNPYLELYKLRITQAELNVTRRQALEELAASRLARGRKLIVSKAISQEEYDTLVSEASVTTADRVLALRKVEESKTYFKIVEAMVRRGVSIPLCTYEME